MSGSLLHKARAWPNWRHGLAAVLPALMVCLLAMGLQMSEAEALEAIEEEVRQLQARLQTPPHQLPPIAASRAGLPPTDGPAMGEQGRVWVWLQQRLRAHGFQLQSLGAQPALNSQGLHEQLLSLRLEGSWHSWRHLEQAMNVHAPWLVIEQWLVLPVAEQPEVLRFEVQARLAWHTGPPLTGHAAAWQGPMWTVPGDKRVAGTQVFASPQGLAGSRTDARQEAPSAVAADPEHSPSSRLRLLGIWQQAGLAHPVFGDGLHALVVGPGRQLGSEVDRAWRAHPPGEVQAQPEKLAQVKRQTFKGGPR